ncbi:MAG: ATP synthase F0 subunit A [Phycisphaerales bacterium]|nr:MAG: ATP synthase F0 subunit A [Phycisphaerales bacterium]
MPGSISLPQTLGATNPVEHVVNHSWWVTEGGWWIWSAQQSTLVLAGLITVLIGLWLAKHVQTGPESEGHSRYVTRNPFAHMIEFLADYLRREIVQPMLGERTSRYIPFLWTLFFFILVNNMLGLVPILDLMYLLNAGFTGEATWKYEHRAPIGGTATQNLFVTAVLAIFSFVVINAAGIKELGVKGYLQHLTAGAPVYVWPIMIPIEILGTFIKPVALALRLFANMTAGHTLLATLFMFVGMAMHAPFILGAGITVASVLGGIAIYFLEIFVGFLQAFVFMFLTAVFISLLSHHGEHHEDHDHAPESSTEDVDVYGKDMAHA